MRMAFFLSVFLLFSAIAQADNASLASQVKALWQAKDYQAAKQLLVDKVTPKTKDAQLLALWGETEAKLNNTDLAEELLKKAVKYEANNADYQHWYATASCNKATSASMFSALGYAKRCKKAYETALKLAPEHPRSYIALASYLAQAPSIAGGDKDAALALANQLKAIDKLQGLLLEIKIIDFADTTDFEQFLEQAVELKSRPEPYFYRAQQLAAKQDYTAAISLFAQAIQQPAVDDAASQLILESRYQLARNAILAKTKITEAIAMLLQFIAESTEEERREWAQFRLAQLYALNGDKELAHTIVQALTSTTEDDKLKQQLAETF
ncbi:hypothetical protein [Rheinheimera sp. MMS21-TC3]|uniref:tetratricopeptide repeat protein n=1 Tax=Rheinheimera sp. MMS21-TC3 TaxID=3072790 RepID=UPI0028C4DB42|nr:hypothetical protein [Rheinheimera sp. MMS21-TC3]WNO61860.1 hypothetical protein RDV63_13115 [Rheinheimera sp. MMS21-TC3]